MMMLFRLLIQEAVFWADKKTSDELSLREPHPRTRHTASLPLCLFRFCIPVALSIYKRREVLLYSP